MHDIFVDFTVSTNVQGECAKLFISEFILIYRKHYGANHLQII